MFSIYASRAILPHGSFEFTPEGYAKASLWRPEDSFSWDDFRNQRFNTVEEFERGRAEFESKVQSKTEIGGDHYCKRSLRCILPDRWLLAYTRDKAWREVNGKKVALYSPLKQTFLFKSIVLGYGQGRIRKCLPSQEAATYIKEHCASAARLKALALRSYESVANIAGYSTWTPVSPPVFLCLAAAKSSLDAMSAVLWALLFRDTPTGLETPDTGRLVKKTRSSGVFHDEVMRLHKIDWFKKLQAARNKVIHRSASPVVHDKFGAAFEFDLGLFSEMRPNSVSAGKPKIGLTRSITRIHLDKIMRGFVVGLEKWEKSIARELKRLAWFPSNNQDGIIMGIEFNDHNLLRDGDGPNLMLTSYDQAGRTSISGLAQKPAKPSVAKRVKRRVKK